MSDNYNALGRIDAVWEDQALDLRVGRCRVVNPHEFFWNRQASVGINDRVNKGSTRFIVCCCWRELNSCNRVEREYERVDFFGRFDAGKSAVVDERDYELYGL